MLLTALTFASFVTSKIILCHTKNPIPFSDYIEVCKNKHAKPFHATEMYLQKIFGLMGGMKHTGLAWVASYDNSTLKNVGIAIGEGKEGLPILEITKDNDKEATNAVLCWKKKKDVGDDVGKKSKKKHRNKRDSSDSDKCRGDLSSSSSEKKQRRHLGCKRDSSDSDKCRGNLSSSEQSSSSEFPLRKHRHKKEKKSLKSKKKYHRSKKHYKKDSSSCD